MLCNINNYFLNVAPLTFAFLDAGKVLTASNDSTLHYTTIFININYKLKFTVKVFNLIQTTRHPRLPIYSPH